jgi:hypothetical protein
MLLMLGVRELTRQSLEEKRELTRQSLEEKNLRIMALNSTDKIFEVVVDCKWI